MSGSRPTRTSMDERASIAVDLGAESCRVSLFRLINGEPDLQLVHRFPNGPVRATDGSLRWPLQTILDGVEHGVRLAAQLAPEGVSSIAVDGWSVDYVQVDREGQALEDPFCYRDERNIASANQLHQRISVERMREITGIEQQPLNTLYQLYADKLSGKPPSRWLNLPEYLLYRWGAEPVAEHTNASHTQLVDLFSENWSREIFQAAELSLTCAPRIIPPGTILGKLSGPLASLPGLGDTDLIAPACHDTASAIAGIAETGEDWAYISCGTWSLVGTLNSKPLNSPGVRQDNFTNLGAVGGMTCFHKSINGMWVLKQCMDHWAEDDREPWSIVDLLSKVDLHEAPVDLLHMDDPELLGMGDMPARINAQLRARGLGCLSEHSKEAPGMVCLLLHSLAARYAQVIERIRIHTGKDLRRIVMVGGGAQNATLRRLTAEHTGLQVIMGPSESSTVGNFAVQRAVIDGTSPTSSAKFREEVVSWAREITATVRQNS
jgi:rhamnulokinase